MNRQSLPSRGSAEQVAKSVGRRAAAMIDTAAAAGSRIPVPGKRTISILAGTAAALAATALAVEWQARRAEHRHPPKGRFVRVDGVRLHYVEAGSGDPVVLLHGNASMLEDMLLSIFPALAEHHRVIAFDRPGFGWSERTHDRAWTPEAQATLIRRALRRLGVERPVLYGHSFAAPVVVTYAMLYPEDTRGIVAASGYYYPNVRADSAIAHAATLPVLGPVLRHTLLPAQGAAFGRLAVEALFDPAPVPETWAVFPASLALRPSQLRAAGEDGCTLRDWAKRSAPYYGEIGVPLMIVAGTGDRAVDPIGHSRRLHEDVPGSRLRLWSGTGHMVHHTRPAEVIQAIEEVFEMSREHGAAGASQETQEVAKPLDPGLDRPMDRPLDETLELAADDPVPKARERGEAVEGPASAAPA